MTPERIWPSPKAALLFREAGLRSPPRPCVLRLDHDQSFPEEIGAFGVENGVGLVSFRTMSIKPIFTLFLAALLGALIWLGAPVAIGRPLSPWETLVLAAVIWGFLEWLRGRRLRREREQTESMRDSALW
jgi:hypothetical protein